MNRIDVKKVVPFFKLKLLKNLPIHKKFNSAFSLVELMISLITISFIAAAFTPIITKKMKKSNVSVAMSELTTNCQAKFTEECSLCYSQKCVACSRTCGEYQYKNTATCLCENCSDRGVGCAWCDGKYCTQCHWGYGYDSATHSCTLCEPGTYSMGTGPCQKCLKGQYQSQSGKHYCDTATAGYYVPNDGASSQTPCPAGSYSLGGTSSCTTCLAGTYSKQGAASCTNCPTGQYSSSNGASSCNSCWAGSYQGSTGKTTCNPCPTGTYSNAGAASCTNCTKWHAQCTTCNQNGCTACGTNYKVSGTSCKLDVCPTGQYMVGTTCTTCEKGYRCPDGRNRYQCTGSGQYQDSTGQSSCKSGCNSGEFVDWCYETGGKYPTCHCIIARRQPSSDRTSCESVYVRKDNSSGSC